MIIFVRHQILCLVSLINERLKSQKLGDFDGFRFSLGQSLVWFGFNPQKRRILGRKAVALVHWVFVSSQALGVDEKFAISFPCLAPFTNFVVSPPSVLLACWLPLDRLARPSHSRQQLIPLNCRPKSGE